MRSVDSKSKARHAGRIEQREGEEEGNSRLARYVLNRAVTFPSFLAGSVIPTIALRAVKREIPLDGVKAPGTA